MKTRIISTRDTVIYCETCQKGILNDPITIYYHVRLGHIVKSIETKVSEMKR